MVYVPIELLDLGETGSYVLIYGPPIAAAALGLVATVFPRVLVMNRPMGLVAIVLGAGTELLFQYWLTNDCYEDYESCAWVYPLFELGWLLSVGLVTSVVVASLLHSLRRPRTGP